MTFIKNIALDLMNHWIFCNVYTQTYKTVKKRIKGYVDEYHALKNYPKAKRKGAYLQRYNQFLSDCKKLMDIKGDDAYIKKQEQFFGVQCDDDFYEKQSTVPQIGYCTTFTERKWLLSQRGKGSDKERADRARQKAQVPLSYV